MTDHYPSHTHHPFGAFIAPASETREIKRSAMHRTRITNGLKGLIMKECAQGPNGFDAENHITPLPSGLTPGREIFAFTLDTNLPPAHFTRLRRCANDVLEKFRTEGITVETAEKDRLSLSFDNREAGLEKLASLSQVIHDAKPLTVSAPSKPRTL